MQKSVLEKERPLPIKDKVLYIPLLFGPCLGKKSMEYFRRSYIVVRTAQLSVEVSG